MLAAGYSEAEVGKVENAFTEDACWAVMMLSVLSHSRIVLHSFLSSVKITMAY